MLTALEDSARTLLQATPRLAAQQQINMTHDTSWHKSCTCTDKDDKARLLSKGFVVSLLAARYDGHSLTSQCALNAALVIEIGFSCGATMENDGMENDGKW